MFAIRVEQVGGPEVIEGVEVPDPEPSAGELLVRVGAAGVNFIDTYQRSGLYPVPLPHHLGLEGAGTREVGEGQVRLVTGSPGRRAGFLRRAGGGTGRAGGARPGRVGVDGRPPSCPG